MLILKLNSRYRPDDENSVEKECLNQKEPTNKNEFKQEVVPVTVSKFLLKRLFNPNGVCNKSTSKLVNLCVIFSG